MRKFEDYVVPEEAAGTRLDIWLAKASGSSRSQVQRGIREGRITCSRGTCKANTAVRPGEVYSREKDIETAPPSPRPLPLDIRYEDPHILIVNKPAGQLVHPIFSTDDSTLVSALLFHTSLATGADPLRPGIVHRLDRDTSGLLVVAKTEAARQTLLDDFFHRRVERCYLALVIGQPEPRKGTVRLPISRSRSNPLKRKVVQTGGRPAVTHYEVLLYGASHSLLLCRLETGRTHQIRTHLSAMDHPLVADRLYGTPKNPFGFQGQALHAHYLSMIHPVTKAPLTCFAPAPDVFRNAVAKIEAENRCERRNAIYDE